MDVEWSNFRAQLPSVLRAISQSRFVALDLELSGIPSRQPKKPRDPSRDEGGKQTLQERYEETKDAAERFQILQLGLTCVEENMDRGRILLLRSAIATNTYQVATSCVHIISI